MNPLRREQHTLFAGKYYSSTATRETCPIQNQTESTTNLVHVCATCPAQNLQAISDIPIQGNPLQFLNHGFDINYAFQSDASPLQVDFSTQKSLQRIPRISVLWKISAFEQTASLDNDAPLCDTSTNLQQNIYHSSKSKIGIKRTQTRGMEKHYFRRFSLRHPRQNSPEFKNKEALYQNKKVPPLVEDDFIAFVCRKENNLIQNNFMTRAMANIANRLS